MELLLKYEGHHIPRVWARLHGMRMGRNVWVFRLPHPDALQGVMDQLAQETEAEVLALTLVAVVRVADQQSPALLLDNAVPFMVLLTRLRYPWLQAGMDKYVEVHFQPIVDLADGGRIYAHEALCRLRTPQGELLSGYETFTLARHLGRLDALDVALQYKALQRKVADLEPGAILFLNVLPSTLLQPAWASQFLQWLHDLDIPHHEVVIEVVESEQVDPAGLAQRCDALRSQGLRIALDDMGAGFNCLSVLAMVRSDFIKVDRGLVHQARGSRVRSVLLEALVSMAERLGSIVVAEGLERQEDVAFCRSLGIHLVQGFLFAKPAYAPLRGSLALPTADKTVAMARLDRFSITDVIETPPSFDIQTPLTLVRQAFRDTPDLPWCMLTDSGHPVGVLHRGRALSPGLRTVAQGAQPLQRMLPYNIGLTALSRRLYLERMDAAPWAVVDERGCYIGTLEPMMLVSHLLARQEHGASLHPLSQLPTGPTLRQAIDMRIARKHGMLELVYIDLDHFKAFNDRYGFVRGDAMIRTLAEILRHVFASSPDCILGHIGGDDFIVLFDRPVALLIRHRGWRGPPRGQHVRVLRQRQHRHAPGQRGGFGARRQAQEGGQDLGRQRHRGGGGPPPGGPAREQQPQHVRLGGAGAGHPAAPAAGAARAGCACAGPCVQGLPLLRGAVRAGRRRPADLRQLDQPGHVWPHPRWRRRRPARQPVLLRACARQRPALCLTHLPVQRHRGLLPDDCRTHPRAAGALHWRAGGGFEPGVHGQPAGKPGGGVKIYEYS